MPTRIKPKTEHAADVDVWRFIHDRKEPAVGPEEYFGDEGHATREAAVEQWQRVRRVAWGGTYLFDLPSAAIAYDGLSRTAWRPIWGGWMHNTFDFDKAHDAVRCDRRAVEAFITNDPAAAQSISDYVILWLGCLDEMKRCIEDLAQCDPRDKYTLNINGRLTTAKHYDGSDQLSRKTS